MPTNIGRYLTGTKNADGTVTLEFTFGTPQSPMDTTLITLTAAEATALDGVLTGGTGTKSSAQHGKEVVPSGYSR